MGISGIDFSQAPWMQYAERELGVAEIQGHTDNQRIIAYLQTTTYGGPLHDEVPWCSAFVNWCLKQAEIDGTNSASANSWMYWGKMLASPQPGCLVVLHRDDPVNPQAAHVGFFVSPSDTPGKIDILGGNQHDAVNVSAFPNARVKGFRWPA